MTSPLLVLVCDSDARTARMLSRMLREDGYASEATSDGGAAIQRFSREPIPDALITDLRIAHAGGEALARYARSKRPALPVILVTGYPERCLALCETLHPSPVVLTKPADYRELARALSRLLDGANKPSAGGPQGRGA